MTSSTKSGMARSTFSTPCFRSKHGVMTVIDWPLYADIMGIMKRDPVSAIVFERAIKAAIPANAFCVRDVESHGLDQYLANRLTSDHVFRIVTDPSCGCGAHRPYRRGVRGANGDHVSKT